MRIYGHLGGLRRQVKRRTMLTPLDPLVSSLAHALDYFGPRLSPPPAIETRVQVGNEWQLILPAGLPSARRLMAGDYEPEVSSLICTLLEPGMTFVDAGANVGYYTLLAASLVGDAGHVYAFEPDSDAHAYLESNLKLNAITQVTAFRKALADAPGTMSFNPSAFEGGFVSSSPKSEATMQVETESLDHFMGDRGWPRIDLIKLDVEGAESSVLAGMAELSVRNPLLQLIIEFNLTTIRRAGGTPDQLGTALRRLGFQSALIIEQGRQFTLSEGLPKSGLVYNLLITK